MPPNREIYKNAVTRPVRQTTTVEIFEEGINHDVNENVVRVHQFTGDDGSHTSVDLTTTDVRQILEGLDGVSIGKLSKTCIRFTAQKDTLYLSAIDVLSTIRGLSGHTRDTVELMLDEDTQRLMTAIRICATLTICELKERNIGDNKNLDAAPG